MAQRSGAEFKLFRSPRKSRGYDRRGMRRGVSLLPSLFTLANLFCGWACVVYAMKGDVVTAAPFIGFAVVLDMLDGRIARMTGTTSDFGVQLDSLADLISFGMAPAVLAFQWGLDPLGRMGWAVGFVYLTAAALRLARFNIQVVTDKRYFIGLPSPGAAGVVLASVFAFGDQMQGRDRLWVLLIVVVPALLMVTNIRFRSFRSLVSPKSGKPYGLIASAIVLVIGLATVPVITGIALAYGYLLAPLLLPVVAPLARLVPDRVKEALS